MMQRIRIGHGANCVELSDGELQEAICEFAAAFGVNQALFIVAAALTQLAEKTEDVADALGFSKSAAITETSFQVEKLAQMAQRAAI